MLNSKELLQHITGSVEKPNIQQVGIDLNLIEIQKVNGGILQTDKTTIADYSKTELKEDNDGKKYWDLIPGTYAVKLAQGCKVPASAVFFIRQRSSLLRSGGIIHSSVFDPGYECNNIGTIMFIFEPITIEYNARIAQIYAHSCSEVEKEQLYSGQWQGGRMR